MSLKALPPEMLRNLVTGSKKYLRYFSSDIISVKWKKRNGSEIVTKGKIGQSILKLAHEYDIELEGACEGVCACSTCHVILEDKVYDNLPEASEDEEDMLDQAFGLTATSRLGCQIKLTNKHNGMLIKIPSATRNFYVDGTNLLYN